MKKRDEISSVRIQLSFSNSLEIRLFVESALRKRCGFAKRAISFSVLFYHEIPAKSTTFPKINRISREFTFRVLKSYKKVICNYSVNFYYFSCEISEKAEIRPEIHIFPLLFGGKTGIITPLEDTRCNPVGCKRKRRFLVWHSLPQRKCSARHTKAATPSVRSTSTTWRSSRRSRKRQASFVLPLCCRYPQARASTRSRNI